MGSRGAFWIGPRRDAGTREIVGVLQVEKLLGRHLEEVSEGQCQFRVQGALVGNKPADAALVHLPDDGQDRWVQPLP